MKSNPSMTPAPISVDRLRELLAFLDGSGQLDGRSFGDDGPIINGIRRNYWWRADLRHIATLLHQLADAEAQLEDARWQLAYCFQQAGADTDGHFGPHLAPRALQAVTELRRDYDEACSAEHPAPFSVRHFKRKAEAAERAREEARILIEDAGSALRVMIATAEAARWPITAEQMVPLNMARKEAGRIAAFLAASGGGQQ